jgi:hypothetical protein
VSVDRKRLMDLKSCLLCGHCLVIDMDANGVLSGIICDLFGSKDIKTARTCFDYHESEFLRKLQTDLSDLDV